MLLPSKVYLHDTNGTVIILTYFRTVKKTLAVQVLSGKQDHREEFRTADTGLSDIVTRIFALAYPGRDPHDMSDGFTSPQEVRMIQDAIKELIRLV